jgi:hypothetical protein
VNCCQHRHGIVTLRTEAFAISTQSNNSTATS